VSAEDDFDTAEKLKEIYSWIKKLL